MLKLCMVAPLALVVSWSFALAGEKEFIASTGNAYQYGNPYQMKATVYAPDAAVLGGRYVVLPEGVCANDRERILDWAAGTHGFGAVAVPSLPEDIETDCQIVNPNLRGGFADGFASQEDADATALARCEAKRLDGYGECFLIARVADGRE
ncbi:hypothetical protein [Donghicola sp. XS_ASV15]|uniref:hypothetical protein n=1 Tax=Donghicola sp. XS_ASV15 TaxID=3241295 RepID=UPI003514A422